jgi:hypothetical protein
MGAELLHADKRRGGQIHDEANIRLSYYFVNSNKTCTNEETKSRLNSANACCQSASIVCLLVYYLSIHRLKYIEL